MAPLAEAVAEAVAPWLDLPYAVYGHSLAALLSFEVLRRLAAAGLSPPLRFWPARRVRRTCRRAAPRSGMRAMPGWPRRCAASARLPQRCWTTRR